MLKNSVYKMSLSKLVKKLSWIPKPAARFLEKKIKKIPLIKKAIEAENEEVISKMGGDLKPYREKLYSYDKLPETGINRLKVLDDVSHMSKKESDKWRGGYVSAVVFCSDKDHINFVNKVYALQSQNNPLHADLFPSAGKFESEIVSMVANMVGKGTSKHNKEICGTVTSGGTESILCAMKAYRDRAREEKGIKNPEIIAPITIHPAFDKSAHYFGINLKKVKLENMVADVNSMEKAINKNTIALVGSAPSYPHGLIDPIENMSDLALKNNLYFHVDCCFGGFVLPFAEKLGYDVPKVDFRLPGVTSMSVDTHKYGYAPKGTSVVLYRDKTFRHHQYYIATDWPGGFYPSPTLSGSRPGALSAACWATMVNMGEKGYLSSVKSILETAEYIKKESKKIEDIDIIGDPLWIIAFKSDSLNMYEVLDQMTQKGWKTNGLQKPPAFHLAITLCHTKPGVKERFVTDLEKSVKYVKKNPGNEEGLAPVYGMATSMPFRGLISDMLKSYLDLIYKTDKD